MDRLGLQTSRAEVERALRQAGAVELSGKWFRLAPDLAAHLLRLLLLSCAANGWSHNAVPGADAAAALCDDEVDPRCTLDPISGSSFNRPTTFEVT